MSRELVADNICLYVERLRHNMAFEELVLFPSADRHLDGQDWSPSRPRQCAPRPTRCLSRRWSSASGSCATPSRGEAVGTEVESGDAFCKRAS